jgi:glutamate synthase domain-containing protein 1
MMIPEPWENHEETDAGRRAFRACHATRMESWDGPALTALTDGLINLAHLRQETSAQRRAGGPRMPRA